jgi:hypothetical protein
MDTMSKKLQRTVRAFLPSTGPAVVVAVALGLLGLGTFFAVFYAVASFDGLSKQLEAGGVVWGIIFLPLAAILVEIAGLWERSKPAKVILGLLVVGLLFLGDIVTSIAFKQSAEIESHLEAILGVSLICGPLMILAAILPIYGLIRTPAALREIHQHYLEADAVDIIQRAGGEVTYQQLAQALGIPEHRVDPLLRKIVKDQKLLGFREVKYRRFYTVAAYADRQLTLLSLVDSRGAVSLQTLSDEFEVPTDLIEEWIYALVRRGKFTGYLNWDKEIIYSTEAEHLRAIGQCPNCRADMTLAGKGTTRCEHCGTEIFLSVEVA